MGTSSPNNNKKGNEENNSNHPKLSGNHPEVHTYARSMSWKKTKHILPKSGQNWWFTLAKNYKNPPTTNPNNFT